MPLHALLLPPERRQGRYVPRGIDVGIAIAFLLATTALMLATADIGYTRDDTFYFHAAREYAGWFEFFWANLLEGKVLASFTQEAIDAHWSYNPEHPALIKGLFAVSWLLMYKTWGLMGEAVAMRFPAMVFAGGVTAVTYLLCLEITGRRLASVVAAATFILLPHFFFYGHLACFDIPITAMWAAVGYAWWRSLDSVRWAILAGVFFGIALSTKLNAFFLPFVVVGHALWWRMRDPRLASIPWFKRLWPFPAGLWWMAILGPVLFLVLWPRHWFNTVERITWYMNFHLTHEHYHIDYFGRFLIEPPFPIAFPFVLTAITTPIVVLGLTVWGLVAWWRRPALARTAQDEELWRAPGAFLFLFAFLPFAVIAMPNSPIFGGVKHWMNAWPFLLVLLAWGLDDLIQRARTLPGAMGSPKLWAPLLSVALLAPVITATRTSHPAQIAWYNEVIGGVTGAADRGAMRNFWGYSAHLVLPWLNENTERNARLHSHNSTSWAMRQYQAEGMLRDDLRQARDLRDTDWVLYHHPKTWIPINEPNLWERLGSQAPATVGTLYGVPLLSVYRNAWRVPPSPPHAPP